MGEGAYLGAYLGYISKLNFDGSGAARFEEEMARNSTREYAVLSKLLREIVDHAVFGLRTRGEANGVES